MASMQFLSKFVLFSLQWEITVLCTHNPSNEKFFKNVNHVELCFIPTSTLDFPETSSKCSRSF